jgi:hypothetical protein
MFDAGFVLASAGAELVQARTRKRPSQRTTSLTMALEGLFIGAAAIQTLAGWRHSAELAILAMIGCSPDGPWERECQGENCENTEDGYRGSAAGGKGRVLGQAPAVPR